MKQYAFFDLDGTIISDTSVTSFFEYYLARVDDAAGGERWKQFERELSGLRRSGWKRQALNAWFYRKSIAGVDASLLGCLANEWLELRSSTAEFFNGGIVSRLREHIGQGVECVIVTGSFREIVHPIARKLGLRQWISAPLEETDGVYTGNLLASPMIGTGKRNAIRKFLRERSAQPERCYGYGDDISDIPFLEMLGKPSVVSGSSHAALHFARERGWDVISPV